MKKSIALCLAMFVLLSPLSVCFAGDNGEDHVCFMRLDSDQDGSVTFLEFKKVYGNDTEKFQKMDQDNDGKLTHDEYEQFLYNQE